MASRCVNPQCATQWDLFGAGALYAFEKRRTACFSRQREYLWLCASCANHSTLETNAIGNVVVVLRTRARTPARSDSISDLRLVFRSTGVPLPVANGIRKQHAAMINSWSETGVVPAIVSGANQHFGGTCAFTR